MTGDKARRLAEIISELADMMNMLSPHPYEAEILVTAQKLGITVYDASYIVLSARHRLTLVTEDRKLRNTAGEIIEAKCLDDIIASYKNT